MTDVTIDVQPQVQSRGEALQLPVNFLTLGEVAPDDVKVYIHQSTYKKLEKLAASDTGKELGSVLVGGYTEEMGKTHVLITDYIEAKYTDASASTLTFTHETWDYIHKQQETYHKDKKMVGWQHTHPGYGIFLSNYDMFIQENFFNLPFQIAYVIDPVQNLRGFFQWKNGKVEKLKGFYVYDEVGKTIRVDPPEKKAPAKQEKKGGGAPIWVTALLLVLTLVSGILGLSAYRTAQTQAEKLETLEARLDQTPEATVPVAPQDDTALLQKLEEQGKTLEQLQAMVGSSVHFELYTVQSGDTLEKICAHYGVEYYALQGVIIGINGLEDANHIQVGQSLLIPIPNQ